jgi:hypothetical protein
MGRKICRNKKEKPARAAPPLAASTVPCCCHGRAQAVTTSASSPSPPIQIQFSPLQLINQKQLCRVRYLCPCPSLPRPPPLLPAPSSPKSIKS